MIPLPVLCRFSLLLVKYFLKHIEQRYSPGLDKALLPLPKSRAAALSAKGWRYRLNFQKALNKAFVFLGMELEKNFVPFNRILGHLPVNSLGCPLFPKLDETQLEIQVGGAG